MALLNERRQTPRGQSRRLAPRWIFYQNVQTRFSLHDLDLGDASKDIILMGQTYDLSATGLSIVIPLVDCSIRDLLDASGTVWILIETQSGYVEVKAAPVHCENVGAAISGKSACIGMRIEDTLESSYRKYIQFLREFQ
jgi:hypothetical protein